MFLQLGLLVWAPRPQQVQRVNRTHRRCACARRGAFRHFNHHGIPVDTATTSKMGTTAISVAPTIPFNLSEYTTKRRVRKQRIQPKAGIVELMMAKRTSRPSKQCHAFTKKVSQCRFSCR